MARLVAPALRALLSSLIDYAGMFPPAALARDAALENYRGYRNGDYGWMLGRFVIPASQLDGVPQDDALRFAVLSDTDHARADAIECRDCVCKPASKPAYCEAPIEELDRVKQAGAFAKLRTGGITPDAIPSLESVAAYIRRCASLRLSFKATAGLHHPVRSPHPLTYEPGAPSAMMHGFINVFLAAAFVWHGEPNIEPILGETDPSAFRFNDQAHWREFHLSTGEITEARRDFARSFGSCSFEEPIADLAALGWIS